MILNLKMFTKNAESLVSRLTSTRDERLKAERLAAGLAVAERDLDNEVSEEIRQVGISLFKATVEETLPPLLKQSDKIQKELDDLAREYVEKYLVKFRELVTVELQKPILLSDLTAIRDTHEIWPIEARLPDVRPAPGFSGQDGLTSAGFHLSTQLGKTLKEMRGKKK